MTNFKEVYDRIIHATRFKNASVLARAVGITPQAMSNYKKRNIMPLGVVFQISEKYGVSMDWLLFNRGEPFMVGDSTALNSSSTDDILAELKRRFDLTKYGVYNFPDLEETRI